MSSNDNLRNEELPGQAPMRPLVWTCVVILLLWAVTPIVVTHLLGKPVGSAGEFGDLFGSINGLFSGLAFAGIVFTILLQRQELSLQRRELALTRTEISRSAKAQEQSQIALDEQVQALTISARLTALSTLLANYKLVIAYAESQSAKDAAETRRAKYLAEIEDLLAKLA